MAGYASKLMSAPLSLNSLSAKKLIDSVRSYLTRYANHISELDEEVVEDYCKPDNKGTNDPVYLSIIDGLPVIISSRSGYGCKLVRLTLRRSDTDYKPIDINKDMMGIIIGGSSDIEYRHILESVTDNLDRNLILI